MSFFITAPAHPHATTVAVYPALFSLERLFIFFFVVLFPPLTYLFSRVLRDSMGQFLVGPSVRPSIVRSFICWSVRPLRFATLLLLARFVCGLVLSLCLLPCGTVEIHIAVIAFNEMRF